MELLKGVEEYWEGGGCQSSDFRFRKGAIAIVWSWKVKKTESGKPVGRLCNMSSAKWWCSGTVAVAMERRDLEF